MVIIMDINNKMASSNVLGEESVQPDRAVDEVRITPVIDITANNKFLQICKDETWRLLEPKQLHSVSIPRIITEYRAIENNSKLVEAIQNAGIIAVPPTKSIITIIISIAISITPAAGVSLLGSRLKLTIDVLKDW